MYIVGIFDLDRCNRIPDTCIAWHLECFLRYYILQRTHVHNWRNAGMKPKTHDYKLAETCELPKQFSLFARGSTSSYAETPQKWTSKLVYNPQHLAEDTESTEYDRRRRCARLEYITILHYGHRCIEIQSNPRQNAITDTSEVKLSTVTRWQHHRLVAARRLHGTIPSNMRHTQNNSLTRGMQCIQHNYTGREYILQTCTIFRLDFTQKFLQVHALNIGQTPRTNFSQKNHALWGLGWVFTRVNGYTQSWRS
jgi:hypothetical protein